MASIKHRGVRQFQATVSITGYPRLYQTFETKTAAEQWAKVTESDMLQGVFVDRRKAKQISLSQLLTRYADEITPLKKSADNELSLIRRWLDHPLAKRSLAQLSSDDFRDYRIARLKAACANTVRLELALISHAFTIAKQEWSIPVENPISAIRKPKLPEGRDRRLVGDEEYRLMAAAGECKSMNNGLAVAIQLAIETGMRAGEIVGLQWFQIDLNEKVIRLNKTKNGCKRVVPLSLAAEDLLRSLPSPKKIHDRLLAFHDTRGLSKAFRLVCSKLKIVDLRFHDLRHEAASRMAPYMEAQTLAKVMGWKTLQMAMRYYNPTEAELVASRRRVRTFS